MEPRRSRRVQDLQDKGAAQTRVKEAPAPIRKARKSYVRKQQVVAQDMQRNMQKYSEDVQQVIAQMAQRVEQNEADAQAYRNLSKKAVSNEGDDDDGSELDDISMDESDGEVGRNVKKVAQDEGLFVLQSTEVTTLLVANDDEDDEASLITWEDMSGHSGDDQTEENTKYYGFLCAGLNRTYDVMGRGPRNAEKLELVLSHRAGEKKSPNNLTGNRKVLQDEKGDKIRVDGVKVRVDIQGVAWVASECPEDPITLMDPRHWEQKNSERDSKSQKRPKTFPFTSIKLKWVTTHDDGKTTVEKTFETRSTVRSIYGKQLKVVPKTYKIGDRVVLEKGTTMAAADFAIFAAAIISWDRHEKWKNDPSTGRDRSPTPDEDLRTTTTTMRGPKRAARK
ncbi:hypothetical protein CDEST_02056 [Colletotrichum destructivum]|uniref:Uncharacterized protein n=1 Tax=Colletotrichum destructivum TaxID=34406 RepID=A0AAX4I1Q2_9PEZI|nr:hypothetical protein CDEST_01952 [Colletotrichum destructivum]WQF77042.1 hypothetical protein CDEST_02056 [Colletotrichum destructivum]